MAVGANVVPHFVKARTPEMLIRKMLALQSRRGTHIPFFDIQRADGNWYAWYNKEMTSMVIKKEEDNGISKE